MICRIFIYLVAILDSQGNWDDISFKRAHNFFNTEIKIEKDVSFRLLKIPSYYFTYRKPHFTLLKQPIIVKVLNVQ